MSKGQSHDKIFPQVLQWNLQNQPQESKLVNEIISLHTVNNEFPLKRPVGIIIIVHGL